MKRKPLDRAKLATLSPALDAVFHGPGRLILLRGREPAFRMNEREVARLVEAYAEFQAERGAAAVERAESPGDA